MSAAQNPIGVFDSGIGGLTVLHALCKKLPEESFVYLGDTARLPYGTKSKETIIRFTLECAAFLEEQKIKLLVVACNTATAWALEAAAEAVSIPVVGVIAPAVRLAVQSCRSKQIGIVATTSTVHSGAYQKQLQALAPDICVHIAACPLFVPLVEEGFAQHPAASLIAKEYLRLFDSTAIDTLLLGCTHYPLLRDVIERALCFDVQIIDSAKACADAVSELLLRYRLRAACAKPTLRLFFSDDLEKYSAWGEKILGESFSEISLAQIAAAHPIFR